MADAKSVVVPVFASLSSDSEVVIRKEVAGQASLLANFFHEARDDSECHSIILDSIVPVVLEMLQDDNLEVSYLLGRPQRNADLLFNPSCRCELPVLRDLVQYVN